MQRMYQKIRNVPTPIGGLALGIASLGWCLENAVSLHGYGQMIGALVALCLIVLLISRFILHPDTLLNDLRHPVLGSILPTFTMTSMVVSKMIGEYFALTGSIIWCIAVGLHIMFLATFIYHRAQAFSMEHIVPSWFIPPIGLVVAVVTCPSEEYSGIATVLLMFGLLSYSFLLPTIIYRLIFITQLPDASKPTIAILAAPASLLLVGYLNITPTPSIFIVAVLLGIAILMTFVVYIALIRLLQLPFSPGFAAFTFPLAIGATALYKLSDLTNVYGATIEMSHQLRLLAHGELLVATLMIAYVSLSYIRFYLLKRI